MSKQVTSNELGKSVSTHRETRDSQSTSRPAHLQKPDKITIPTNPPASQHGNSGTSGGTSSSDSKGE